MQIISTYPSSFYAICALIALLFSGLLYFRYKREGLSKPLVGFLFLLRALSVFLLAFLLLNPFVRTDQRVLENPTILMALDNSGSILLNKDSAYYKESFASDIESIAEALRNMADLRVMSFGSSVSDSPSFDFNDKQSNYQALFDVLDDKFSNRNITALILASDGLYNTGIDPVIAASRLKIPVYTLALGDTSIQRDIIIKSLRANSYAYKGNKFPISADYEAVGFEGSDLQFVLREISGRSSTVIKSIRNSIASSSEFNNLDFELDAEKAGLKHYRLSVEAQENEISARNNTKDIFIEVLDTKRKVGILAAAPHPDIGALRSALENKGNTEVEVLYGRDVNQNVGEYDLVILHQLPSKSGFGRSLIPSLEQQKTPHWVIAGSLMDLNLFNQQQQMLEIKQSSASTNEVLPVMDGSFKLFQFDGILRDRIKDFPPLKAPFGSYKASLGLYPIFNQKIGSINSDYSLHAVFDGSGLRRAITSAVGLWQWPLAEYEVYKSKDAFNELVSKTVQYLGAQKDKRSFKVVLEKNIFNENESVEMVAELYDASYQPFNEPEIDIRLKDEEGNEFKYKFGRSGKRYFLDAGSLPTGTYTYTAYTDLNGKRLSASGSFIIRRLDLESLVTRADHQLLRRISANTGARSYHISEKDKLIEEFSSFEGIKPISYLKTSVEELINWKWLLALVCFFLSLEWFIRKFTGGY